MHDYSQDEEVQWMLAVQKGDDKFFQKIVEKYQRSLLNLFYYLNANMQEGEDLVQETFLRVYLFRDKYTPTAKFSTFLFRIARNTAIDYFRKKKAILVKEETILEIPADENEDSWMEEKKDYLQMAIKKLPERLRSVVVMSYFEDMKYSEIAEILEIPVGTVKSRMNTAIIQLKQLMDLYENNQ